MDVQIDEQAHIFRRFAEVEIIEISPHYAYLSGEIARDPDLLSIVMAAARGQPTPNLFFAAVRFLLDRGSGTELLATYPTGFSTGRPVGSYRLFRSFVLENRTEIERLLASRRVQSNVVRRAAVLVLGLMKAAELFDDRPFVHIEIGASAGLTLLWERFSYAYGKDCEIGDADSPVRIAPMIHGTPPITPGRRLPKVTGSIGIELEPARVEDNDAISWLRALIHPEHSDNRDLFDAALEIAKSKPPQVLAGDALDLLPKVLGNLARGQPANIYHSHTPNQFSSESRSRLDEILSRASLAGPVTRLAFEGTKEGHSGLTITEYGNGRKHEPLVLANCEAHGRWIEWLTAPIGS
ncbi:MAG: DUF2332 domain-containing protein [Dehalococcoidia bacterium]|nr:DUF2332 domain-containing protein [Dehalococcoidia bacterium]